MSAVRFSHKKSPHSHVQAPNFRQILRQSYNNLSIFVRNAAILRQIYNNANFREKKLMNSLNVINITKYINVNNKTSFVYVTSPNYHQVCKAA